MVSKDEKKDALEENIKGWWEVGKWGSG